MYQCLFFFSDNCIFTNRFHVAAGCSVIDHRGHQNVVKTSVTHLPVACVPLFCLEVSRYPAAGNCFQKTRYPEVRNFDQFSRNSLFNSSKNIRYLFSSLK